LFGALVRRVTAEIGEMRGDHVADEFRNRMLRLADRQHDRLFARLDVGKQIVQPRERRAAGNSRGGRLALRTLRWHPEGPGSGKGPAHKGFRDFRQRGLRPD
jgi:hypothetical protein